MRWVTFMLYSQDEVHSHVTGCRFGGRRRTRRKVLRMIIISGPPASGKSTVARMMADGSPHERVVNLHTDDFYDFISKGYIEPWKPESDRQNTVASRAMAACAESFASGGYEVIVDGVVGPWHLGPWLEVAKRGAVVYYMVLRPSLEMTIRRNANREKTLDAGMIEQMWTAFSDLGSYESHVLDTTEQSPAETVAMVRRAIEGRAVSIMSLSNG